MNVSQRIKILRFDGVEIMESDYSSIIEEDYLELSDRVVDYVLKKHPKHSYLLMNINKTLRNSSVIDASKKNVFRTEHCNSSIALYNSNDLMRVVVKIITYFSKKKTHSFRTREEALAFLLKDSKNRKNNLGLYSFRNSLPMF